MRERTETCISMEPVSIPEMVEDRSAESIIQLYKASNSRFNTYIEWVIDEIFKPNLGGSLNLEKKILMKKSGTTTSGKSLETLIEIIYLTQHPKYLQYVADLGYEPTMSYHHIKTDIDIAMDLEYITSPQGQITREEYNRGGADVTRQIRNLVFEFLPGYNLDGRKIRRPHMHFEDTIDISAFYLDGEIFGTERGDIEGTRMLIANRFPVFSVGMNTSEEVKDEGMILRETVPTLSDDEVYGYLEKNGVIDRSRSPEAVKRSYVECGNRPTREQQYADIRENMFFLMRRGLFAEDFAYKTRGDWESFLKDDPIKWERYLNQYIVLWQEKLFGAPEHPRTIFLDPKKLSRNIPRYEPREWFDQHEALDLLKQQAQIRQQYKLRGAQRLINELQSLHLDPFTP